MVHLATGEAVVRANPTKGVGLSALFRARTQEVLSYLTVKRTRKLEFSGLQRSASPQLRRETVKLALPLFVALKTQVDEPQPVPGCWQPGGAVGPGAIVFCALSLMSLRLVVVASSQKTEFREMDTWVLSLSAIEWLLSLSLTANFDAAEAWAVGSSSQSATTATVAKLRARMELLMVEY